MAKEEYGKVTINAVRFVINYVARFAFAAILVYCCWIPFQKLSGWFSYHVIFCTFGYLPLMAESLMLFVGDELWSRQVSRKAKYVVHGTLVSVGTVFIIVGNALVFQYLSPGYHLYTAHGITGLISMIILIISLGLGLAVNYPETTKRLFASVRPAWMKLIHNVVGLLGYAIGIISLCYGYYTKWFIFHTGEESRLTALVATIIVSIWSINGAVVSAYHQLKAVFK